MSSGRCNINQLQIAPQLPKPDVNVAAATTVTKQRNGECHGLYCKRCSQATAVAWFQGMS